MTHIFSKKSLLASPYLLWQIGFTIIPLLLIIRYAFTNIQGKFTLENILAIFSPINMKAFILSLEIAIICTLLCIILSYPLVMALKHINFSKGNFILFALILPMWMNFILRLLAWQMILSPNGLLNSFLQKIGLAPLNIANSNIAIMIGIVYDFLPYMVLPIYTSINDIDSDIIEAAKDLGANSITTFFRIILPLSVPGLKSGITMVFVPAMTSFVISNILGGGKLQLIGNIIEHEFTKNTEWHLGSGLSVSLMIFVLISMAFTINNNSNVERENEYEK